MRILNTLVGLALGLGALSCSRAESTTCDVSTEAAARVTYKKLTGKEQPQNHPCIKISTSFPGLAHFGSFKYDRGCRYDDTVFDCKVNDPNLAASVLGKAGWAKADAKQRQALALKWLREELQVETVTAEPKGWPATGKKFVPLSAKALPDGGIEFQFWQRHAPRMRPIETYTLESVVFSASGTPSQAKQLDETEIHL